MTKPHTNSTYKVTIPALLVSYSATVQAEGPVIVSSSDGNANTYKPATHSNAANTFAKARSIIVASATEQLGGYQYQGGKIDLNRVSFGQLQSIMDTLANSDCTQTVQTACGWKVLKLERVGRGKDGDQFAGISAIATPKVAKAELDTKRAIVESDKIAASDQEPAAAVKVKHRPDQPGIIANSVQQRLAAAEWTQSFSALHPDKFRQNTAELTTPITVELTRASEVSVVVNGNEASSELMPAGRHTLNTDSLPEGSYPLAVHIKNGAEDSTVVEQIFGRHRLATTPSSAAYGALKPEPVKNQRAITADTDEIDLLLTLIARATTDSVFGESSSGDEQLVAHGADVTLHRGGNQYYLTIDGSLGGQTALSNTLKAAFLGKNLALTIQGVGFIPARELTGDIALAHFLNKEEHQSLADLDQHQGRFELPLASLRNPDPHSGLLESRSEFATRLRRSLGISTNKKQLPKFQFSESDDTGIAELKIHLATDQNVFDNMPTRSASEFDIEIDTPFFNLG